MTASGVAFNPSDLKGSTDPYALFRAGRRGGPVQSEAGYWLILGHREASDLLRSAAGRSGFIADGYRRRLPAGAAQDEMAHRINFLDPPRHGQVRRLIGKVFTPRRTSRLRPFIEDMTRKLLEGLPEQKPIDLIDAYAHEVPSLVISELLGVPVEHRGRLTVLSERVSRLLSAGVDDDELSNAVSAAEEMHATLRAVRDARRSAPEDDLLSALLGAGKDAGSDALTEPELLSLAATLYSAGHRTTRDLFSNGLTALLSDPDAIAALIQGRLPTTAVVEEFLRFETPTHLVSRMLQEPLLIGERTIPANEPIVVVLAAANRDPEVYADADRFDPWRWTRDPAPPPPLSFALGAHFCIGASLARLEVSIMLEMLFRIYPNVRLDDAPLRWLHTGVFRGLEALPVVLGPRAENSR